MGHRGTPTRRRRLRICSPRVRSPPTPATTVPAVPPAWQETWQETHPPPDAGPRGESPRPQPPSRVALDTQSLISAPPQPETEAPQVGTAGRAVTRRKREDESSSAAQRTGEIYRRLWMSARCKTHAFRSEECSLAERGTLTGQRQHCVCMFSVLCARARVCLFVRARVCVLGSGGGGQRRVWPGVFGCARTRDEHCRSAQPKPQRQPKGPRSRQHGRRSARRRGTQDSDTDTRDHCVAPTDTTPRPLPLRPLAWLKHMADPAVCGSAIRLLSEPLAVPGTCSGHCVIT